MPSDLDVMLTKNLIDRTLTVDGGGAALGQVVLTGGRAPLRHVADLQGHDVVVLTLAEIDALRRAERERGAVDALRDTAAKARAIYSSTRGL